MAEALSLVCLAHHKVFQVISNSAGRHFEGLSVAARHLKHRLSSSQQRRLRNLDIACNLSRHITLPLIESFIAEMEAAVGKDELMTDSMSSLVMTLEDFLADDGPSSSCSAKADTSTTSCQAFVLQVMTPAVPADVTLSNDMGRLTEEQIEKMIKEAEQFADEYKKVKERVDAKMSFVSYLNGMRNAAEGSWRQQGPEREYWMRRRMRRSWTPSKMDNPGSTSTPRQRQRRSMRSTMRWNASVTPIVSKYYGAGKSEKIAITNDMGSLSEEQIEQMIKEAEHFADEDKKVKERADAKMSFVSYLNGMRNAAEGAGDNKGLREKLDEEENEKIMDAIKDGQSWLDSNPEAEAEEINEKHNEVEGICDPIVSKYYGWQKREDRHYERHGSSLGGADRENDQGGRAVR